MKANNKAFCKYSNEATFDSGVESLKLYLPVQDGFINYNIVHSVVKNSNCDTWRLSVVYFCDCEFNCIRPLTRPGAEWEMALKLVGRPDFIGGYAHGDELYEKIALTVDGKIYKPTEINDLTSFDELSFEVWSKGFDPNDSVSEALYHYKKITVDKKKVSVDQEVKWLNSYELKNSYLAMMPLLKSETDLYRIGKEGEYSPIPESLSLSEKKDIDAIYMLGSKGFIFSLEVNKYLTFGDNENQYLLSDNGGVPYNKIYFILNHGGSVAEGDIWNTTTVYTIEKRS